MTELLGIHDVAVEELKQSFALQPVQLKHPMPERPPRLLGLVRIDGQVYSCDKFSRAVFLQIELPVYFKVRSMFLRPHMELDLPVFSCEVMVTGSKIMVIVDIHRTGANTGHDDSALFAKMRQVRDRYPNLNARAITQKGEIQSVFSEAACQVRVTRELDGEVISLFKEYLAIYTELVQSTAPATGETLADMKGVYEAYLKTLVDHDPGVKGFKIFFGSEGGVERTMDIHFAR